MNKIAAIILILALSLSPYATATDEAEVFDLSTMTKEQLFTLLDSVRFELDKRGRDEGEISKLLLDEAGIRVEFNDWEIRNTSDGDATLAMQVTIINETDTEMMLCLDDISLNGWQISDSTAFVIRPLLKSRAEFQMQRIIQSAGIKSIDDIQDIRCVIKVLSTVDYREIASVDMTLIQGDAKEDS